MFPVLVSFPFLLDNWNPRLIEKDIFLYIYLWLPFLQSRPRSCDSCLYYLQTHHCLTQPHQGPVSSISGRQLEMLAAGLPCSECPVLALALICKALQCPEAGLPARTARILCQGAAQHQEQHSCWHCLPVGEGASGRALERKELSKSLSFFQPWGAHVRCLQATLQSSLFIRLGRGKESLSFSAE